MKSKLKMTTLDDVFEEGHYYNTLSDMVDLCQKEGYYLILGDLCNTVPVTERLELFKALDKIVKEF